MPAPKGNQLFTEADRLFWKEPIFEVRSGDHVYRIWDNGKIEGFPDGAQINNRIPLAFAQLEAENIKCREFAEFGREYLQKMGDNAGT